MQVPSWYDGDVSRETLDKLNAYAVLLSKWTQKINLIAKSTIEDIEQRHIWDSAQVYERGNDNWLDLGSGGGLPGVVIAILAQGEGDSLSMTLVESDQRKAVFLRTCMRELSIPLNVIDSRVEDLPPMKAGIVSARALASLTGLLDLAENQIESDTRCIFSKGANWREEVDIARRNWRFSCEATPSKTHPEAVILHLKEVKRV